MKFKILSRLIVAAPLAIQAARAGMEAVAEEIWSQDFCEQAVLMAKQRGESPEALNLVDCRLLNYYQPSYWQCVIAAMKTNTSVKLDAARQKCLDEY